LLAVVEEGREVNVVGALRPVTLTLATTQGRNAVSTERSVGTSEMKGCKPKGNVSMIKKTSG
jgi:hypothetical protein